MPEPHGQTPCSLVWLKYSQNILLEMHVRNYELDTAPVLVDFLVIRPHGVRFKVTEGKEEEDLDLRYTLWNAWLMVPSKCRTVVEDRKNLNSLW